MSDNEKFTLIYNIVCPQVRSILFIEKAAGIPIKKIKCDMEKEETSNNKTIHIKEPIYRLHNSDHSLVPINDFHAICTYLSIVSENNHTLYPCDVLKHYQIDNYIYIHAQRIYGGLLNYLEPIKSDYHKIDENNIIEAYKEINALLKEDYIDGDDLTIVDLYFMVAVNTFKIFVPLTGVPECEELQAWYDRVIENESYKDKREYIINSYISNYSSQKNYFLPVCDCSKRSIINCLANDLFHYINKSLKPIREERILNAGIIHEVYQKINDLLKENGPYIAGNEFTIADLFFMATVHTLKNFVPVCETADCNNFKIWYNQVLEENPFIVEINNDPEYDDEFYLQYQELIEIIKIREEFEKFSKVFIKSPINKN